MMNRVKNFLARILTRSLNLMYDDKIRDVINQDIFIDPTAIVDSCVFEKWIKIQRQSYLYNSSVGSYTYFAGFNSVMNSKIGKFCSIGAFVSISPGKHPVDYISTSPVFFSPYKQCGVTFADKSYYREMGSVLIGNDVWIGANSIILDDVTIGDGAVIAANSVVNKDVEPYSIVGGTPAKFIKKRFSDDLIGELLKFKWWDKDENWLKDNFRSFHSSKDFEELIKESSH